MRALRWPLLAMLGLMAAGLGAGAAGAGTASGAPHERAAAHALVTSLKFPKAFVPEQVVSEAGEVWVLGSSGATTCSLDEVNPTTLRVHSYPIPLCAYYVTEGDGRIYLAGDVTDVNSDVLHLEVFDPTTKHAAVMSPVMLTTQGSTRAHLDMAYGAGSIWMSSWASTVVQVSPETGAVLTQITDAPQSNGGHGTLVANSSGLWMAQQASAPGSIDRRSGNAANFSTIYIGPATGFISWLSSSGEDVWAAVQTGIPGRGGPVSTKLIAFNAAGQEVLSGPSETFGDVPLVGSGEALWSVGTGGLCAAPQKLWRIDAATGKSTAVATLGTPIEPCLTENPTTSMIAVEGNSVFVLEPTGSASPAGVLYRVRVAAAHPQGSG